MGTLDLTCIAAGSRADDGDKRANVARPDTANCQISSESKILKYSTEISVTSQNSRNPSVLSAWRGCVKIVTS